MTRYSITAAVVVCAALLAVPAALADSCGNVSRAPAACGTVCTTGPIIQGNWVWLPSIDPNAPPMWGFNPPGAPDSSFGFPDANGQYGAHVGASLLDASALCDPTSNASSVRQKTQGIQSGCE